MRKALFLALAATAAIAQAAIMANLVRQYISTSVTGKTIVVCVYSAQGREFEQIHPLGTACPTYVMVE